MKTIVDYAEKVKAQHALNKTLAPVETDLTDASQAYAIGDQFIYDGVLYKAKTAIAQHDALVLNTNYEDADDITTQIKNKTVTTDPVPTEGSTNPVQSNGVYVDNRNIYEVMGQNGAKNLLDATARIRTGSAVSQFSYDGQTIIVNGNLGDAHTRLYPIADDSSYVLPAGTYILSGECSDNNLSFTLRKNGTAITSSNPLTTPFEFSANGSDYFTILLHTNAATYTDATAKAMICLKSWYDIDPTYQLYAMTNSELTAENEALTNKLNNEIVTRSELGAKNLLPYDIQKIKAQNTAGTWNGNTYTPINSSLNITLNTDGSITVDGTSSSVATATLYLYGNASEAKENIFKGMIASGCPSDGATNKYSLAIQGFSTATPSGGNSYHDIGEGVTVGNDDYARVYVRIQNNITVSNLTFKPMIRLASDPDATYQPYAKTNQELTAENQTLTNLIGETTVKNLASNATSIEFDVPTSGNNLIEFFSSDGSNYTAIDTSVSGKVTLTFDAVASARKISCRIATIE